MVHLARFPAARLKLARCPHSLTASLAALPSMSLIPFAPLYLGSSRRARPLPRGLTGHVAHPFRSIVSRQLPPRSTATSRLNRPCCSSLSFHSPKSLLI